MSAQAKASGYEQQLQIQKLFDINSHVLAKITLLPNIYFTLNKIIVFFCFQWIGVDKL